MDPLSIAASAAGLATGCTKIVATLYIWIDDTIAVDENVAGLCDEVKALGRVLESISSAAISAPRPVIAEIDPDGSLWAVVKATLDDINNILVKLSQLLSEVQKSSGVFSRSFLREPTKQIKFGFRSKEIATYKNRVQSYNTAMTSALQMINVCLMIHRNSSQDAVFNVLYGLKSQIGRVEIALHQGTQSNSGPTGSSQDADGNQIARNLRQLVRVAETFHSNASAITREGPRSTVWGGSVLGDPLTREQFSNIENWIPPPSNNQGGTTSPRTVVDPSYHSDSDDDIDKALLKRLRELAVESRQKGDYAKAENFYRKVINRSEVSESNYGPQDLIQDRINLAYACLHQRKWADAEAIILPIAMERKLADIAVYVSLHALALAHMHSSDFAKADLCCKRALWGKRKIFGKENPSCWETLALLSRICEARGETEEAEAHRTFIPASYQPVLHVDPLVYLGGYDKKKPQPPILQIPSSSTTPVSQSRKLIVGVHFGAAQTAVSFALATSIAAEEAVVSAWPGGRGTEVRSTIPSVLYYSRAEPTRTILGWGYDIVDALTPTGYPKPGVHKSEWFMLGLMSSQLTYIRDLNIQPPAGKSQVDVVADYLSKLRDAIFLVLCSSFDMEEIHIQWWFAIPPVWNSVGEASLRASAVLAGFIRGDHDDRIFFVTESVAYVLYCCKTLLVNPQPSDAFLVVVAGKATVDLVSYEVTSGHPLVLKQLTTPSGGGFCGSTALNRNFSELLRKRVGMLKLPKEESKLVARTYAKGIVDFEYRIKHAFSDDGSTWAVKVGLFADYPDAGIDRESGCMAVTNEVMLSCYKPVVDRVIELISDQLTSAAKYHPRTRVKTILLTGEFSMSEYLVKQVKLLVGAAFDVAVVTPSDALTDIARGAVRAGVLQAHGLLPAEYLTRD
ncbi:Kinesin light chain 1 [Madurella mycetomatis]|uniref:Kinesin light chain 1 n=1 Tax=Madurella mycetomatis TaxID=100816 RepID=A0A175W0N2_9PEZI|nr:Kinesin light chain 1 [Madurella mycetomatis]